MFKTLYCPLSGIQKKCKLLIHSEGISSLLEEQDIKMLNDIYETVQASTEEGT